MTQPTCDYMTGILKIAERLGIGAWQVEVAHDTWCPMVQGDGSKPCEPDFYVLGRKVKP